VEAVVACSARELDSFWMKVLVLVPARFKTTALHGTHRGEFEIASIAGRLAHHASLLSAIGQA
jgi:hypothetical protein